MRKIMNCFLLMTGIAVLSFAVREAVSDASVLHFDAVTDYAGQESPVLNESEPAAADDRLSVYDGIVIDVDTGFSHRCFYVRPWNGHIAVFNWRGSLCLETEAVLAGVETSMRGLIEKGIYFNSFEDARGFIDSL